MDRRAPPCDKEGDDVALLMSGVDHWNEKRPRRPNFCDEDIFVRFLQAEKLVGEPRELPSLAGADFSNGKFVRTQFDSMFAPAGVDLRSVDFRRSDLRKAALSDA